MKIEACPFCGSTTAPQLFTWTQINGADEGKDRIAEWAVCCDIQMGGCGATGPYYLTQDRAIKKWNRRTTQP